MMNVEQWTELVMSNLDPALDEFNPSFEQLPFMIQLSQAISLRRIATALEKMEKEI